MNDKTFFELIQLNKDFYKKTYEKFDKTRQAYWNGWYKVLRYLNELNKDSISVLDIGCGNGRFLKFLTENLKKEIKYVGLDSSVELLDIAKNNFKNLPNLPSSNYKFINCDVITEINEYSEVLDRTFDVVVVFGLTHHIPSKNYRMKWFDFMPNLISNNGLFIFTIWKYNKDKRFNKAIQEIKLSNLKISRNDLEENDFFLSFDNINAYRYVHIYTKNELDQIDNILKKKSMKIVQSFLSDGQSNNLNQYFIYKKLHI